MANKAVKILWIILAAIILAFGAVVFSSWCSNGWESAAPLYVKYEGAVLKSKSTLSAQKEAVIYVRSAGFSDKAANFKIKITPNKRVDFAYTVNGEERKFSALDNLTSAFKINFKADCFAIDFTDFNGEAEHDMLGLLKSYYGENAEIVLKDRLKQDERYLALTVLSEDENYSAKTVFNVLFKNIPATGIEIDPDKVIV